MRRPKLKPKMKFRRWLYPDEKEELRVWRTRRGLRPIAEGRHAWDRISDLLRGFWRTVGFHGCKTRQSGLGKERTLELLRSMAGFNPGFRHRMALEDLRSDFDRRKKKIHRLESHQVCFACGAPATCRHHLIQLQKGGPNTKRNVVSLCNQCHAEIHPWLKTTRRFAAAPLCQPNQGK